VPLSDKGFPSASPAEQDGLLDYFVDLDPFFEGGLLYSGNTHLNCDAEWWVKLFIARQKPLKIREAFRWAHKKVRRFVLLQNQYQAQCVRESVLGITARQPVRFGETLYSVVVSLQDGLFRQGFG
jgi:hypothetical protein